MTTNRFGALNILPSNIRDITDIEDVKKFLEDLTFSLNMGIKRLEEGVIDTRYISDYAVTHVKIADYTITGDKIANGTITASNIDDLTITADKIANLTITGGKIANATIEAAKLSFTAFDLANDTLDNIEDGSTWGKVYKTDISSGHILLSACEGSLDDIEDGTNWGKVASTAISAGKIVLTNGTGVTGELPATHTEADVTQTVIDGGLVTTGYLRSNNWASSAGTQLELNDETLKFGGSGVTASGAQAGIFFGKDSGEYKAFIGNTTKNIKYDPTNGVQLNGELVVNGNIVDEEIRPSKLKDVSVGNLPECISSSLAEIESSTYVKIKEAVIARSGTYRIKYEFACVYGSSTYAYTKIYKNDSAYGTEHSSNSAVFTAVSEDLSFSAGDTIAVYAKGLYGGSDGKCQVKNFQVCVSEVFISAISYDGPPV